MNYKTIIFIIGCIFATPSFTMFKAIQEAFKSSPRTIAQIDAEIKGARFQEKFCHDHPCIAGTCPLIAEPWWAGIAKKLEEEKAAMIDAAHKEIERRKIIITALESERKKDSYLAAKCATYGQIQEQQERIDELEKRIKPADSDSRA